MSSLFHHLEPLRRGVDEGPSIEGKRTVLGGLAHEREGESKGVWEGTLEHPGKD